MTLKTVFAPHLGRHVKMGRTRPVPGTTKLKLHFRDYVDSSLPTPPTAVSYSSNAEDSIKLVYKNDELGDCVIAGGYHCEGVWTGNASPGSPFLASDDQIISDYSSIGGYVPGDPSTDGGCNEETALQFWSTTGFANGDVLEGYVEVDASNVTEVQQACWLFEGLMHGLELPDTYVNPFPSASGFTWDVGEPDDQNGHCIISCGYDTTLARPSLEIATWGLTGWFTFDANATLCVPRANGGLYTMFSKNILARGAARAPNGFSWVDLASDFAKLRAAKP